MKFWEHKEIWIMALISSAGTLFAACWYVPVAWQKYVISQSLHRQSLTMSQVALCSSQIATLEKQIAELEPKASQYEKLIPADRRFAALWGEFSELMTRHNLSNQQVQPGAETVTDKICSVSLDIQCTGTLKDVFEFTRSIEKLDRLVSIRQMEFENDKSMTGTVMLKAKAKVFYRSSNDSINNS